MTDKQIEFASTSERGFQHHDVKTGFLVSCFVLIALFVLCLWCCLLIFLGAMRPRRAFPEEQEHIDVRSVHPLY